MDPEDRWQMLPAEEQEEAETSHDVEQEESEQEEPIPDLPLTAAALEALQQDLPPALGEEDAESEHSASTGAPTIAEPRQRGRRHPRCAEPGCKFSTTAAGQPCQVRQEGEKCMWCSPEKLEKALATAGGRTAINRVLNQLQRARSPALPEALRKLPADFMRKCQYCTSPGCCCSRKTPGKPAQAEGNAAMCGFCNFEGGRLVAEGLPGTRMNLWVSLAVFAKKDEAVLGKAWLRISDDMKRGCHNYMEWLRSGAAKKILRAAQKKARKERNRMEKEDFQPSFDDRCRRPCRQVPRPHRGHGITIQRSSGPKWCLKPPQRTCHHPARKYGAEQEWRCPMNVTAPPPCPPAAICRVCTHGFRRHDPKPALEDYYGPDVPAGLFPEPHQEQEAQRKFARDMDLWEEMQPQHIAEGVAPGSLRALAITEPRGPSPRFPDTAGLFPAEEQPAASAASSSRRARPQKRRMEWPVSFTPRRQQAMRDMGADDWVDAWRAKLLEEHDAAE